MDFQLLPIEETDLPIFKHDMQEAFQLGAAAMGMVLGDGVSGSFVRIII